MKKIVKIVLNNYQYKILAVIFAFLLWILATKQETIVSVVSLPLKVEVKGDLAIRGFEPDKLELKVEGSKRDLAILREEGKAVVTLKPFQLKGCVSEKECEIPVTIDMVRITPTFPGITLDELITKTLKIKFEKLEPTILPVQPVLKGRDKRKYFAKKVEPNYITVYLPKSEVKRVKKIYLLPIDTDRLKGNAVIEVKVNSSYKCFPETVKVYIVRR